MLFLMMLFCSSFSTESHWKLKHKRFLKSVVITSKLCSKTQSWGRLRILYIKVESVNHYMFSSFHFSPRKEMTRWPLRGQDKYLWSFVFDFYTAESYLTCLKLKCRVETSLALTNKGIYDPHTRLSSKFLNHP